MRNPVEIVVASDSLTRSEINGSGNASRDARTTDHRRKQSLSIPRCDLTTCRTENPQPNHGSAPYVLSSICGVFYLNFTIHLSQIEQLEQPQLHIEQPYISNIRTLIILSNGKGKSSIFETFEIIEIGEQLTSIDGPR